ncbi:sugar transporter SWEET1 [Homalodisca vitripennis]|nr:sugar transporter SWEET1 [Homalodisca vitripennis]
MVLAQYKELVGTAAAVTTIGQFLSPLFVCKKIVKNGSAKGMDPMPFIGGMAMSVLFLQYGIIIDDPAMIPVNIFGFVLNVAYSICFYMYTTEKTEFLSSVGKVSAVTAVLVGYALWEKQDLVEFRFGMIVTVLMLALIGAPLFSLGEIIKNKSTESLPFPMIAAGTVVSTLWLLYAIIIENVFMQVQNIVALLLCLIQLSLFVIYPSTQPKVVEEKKKK